MGKIVIEGYKDIFDNTVSYSAELWTEDREYLLAGYGETEQEARESLKRRMATTGKKLLEYHETCAAVLREAMERMEIL